MLTGTEDSQDAHDQVYNNDVTDDNKGSFTHELVGGAAAFEAMRLYEQKQASEGKSSSSFQV